MITQILNQLLKDPKTQFRVYSSCSLMPLDFIGTIERFEELSNHGELLISFLNIQTGKSVLIGTNHPQLTITHIT
jgi:hypothetical protein